ncbi:MAG TPA: DUF2007 domain-containing protein [Prolixibacteraceae bacterium]|nr:DUF2007 domain-containing protein [Prolixibacteraceae bacterium]
MEKGWKEVLLTPDEVRATMARDILTNAEIDAVILNQRDSAYHAFGEFVVYVQEASFDKALELIKELKN